MLVTVLTVRVFSGSIELVVGAIVIRLVMILEVVFSEAGRLKWSCLMSS